MRKESRSKNDSPSKSKVKFYFESSDIHFDPKKFLPWVLPVLKRIQAQDHPSKIAETLETKKQNIHYYIKKLTAAGFIYREKRSNIVIYQLTERSKNLLKSCEGKTFPAELHRLDKGQVSYPIVKEGVYPKHSFREVEMVNWTALLGLELGIKVRHTTKSWIVHVPVLAAKSFRELVGLEMNLANKVALALSLKYGVVLADGKPIGGEHVIMDPVAAICGKYVSIRTKERKIDHSWGEGELENLTPDAAVEYMRMPATVRDLNQKVERLEIKLNQFISQFGFVPEDPTLIAEGQKRLGEYIS